MQKICTVSFACWLLWSCSDSPKGTTHEPIVLGNPATIVTETDSQYLASYIPEYVATTPRIKDTAVASPEPARAQDTVPPTVVAPAPPPPTGKGHTVVFANASIFVPGITVREPDKATGSSVAYALTEGSLSQKVIQATKGSLQEVQQQYTAAVWYQDGQVQFPLPGIADYTSSWETLKNNNTGNLSSEAGGMRTTSVNGAALRQAVQKGLQSQKLSRNVIQEKMAALGTLGSPYTPPLVVKLRVLKWKLKGKGTDGKDFRTQVRFDLP